MPIALSCSSCKNPLKVPDQLVGKRVKCPKCGQPSAVPAPQNTGIVASSRNGAKATEQTIAACAGCGGRLKVKPELAGKALKCPKCAHVGIPVPDLNEAITRNPAKPPTRPADETGEEEIEVTAAYTPSAGAKVKSAVGDPNDWGEELLEGQGVPTALHEKIRKELTRGERIVWFERPNMEIMSAFAGRSRLIGLLIIVIGAFITFPLSGFFIYLLWGRSPEKWIGLGVAGFLLLFYLSFAALGLYMMSVGGKIRRGQATRACFMLTNRRVLIHRGMGKQYRINPGGNDIQGFDADEASPVSYNGIELMTMRREEYVKHAGFGELCFGRSYTDRPVGPSFYAIPDPHVIEKKIREMLVDPVVTKVLGGQVAVKGEVGQKRDEDEILAPAGNLRKAIARDGGAPDDADVKKIRAAGFQSVKELDDEQREKVDAELTKGEKILWVGEPEGKTQGRGMLGAMVGAADRREPDYELYVLTNRRMMLFDVWGSKIGGAIHFGTPPKCGPVSYYPPAVLDAGLEEDSRIPNGGSIIFKKVKYVITTSHKNRVSKSTEYHYFGILRIRKYESVARLVFETLIRPCKRA